MKINNKRFKFLYLFKMLTNLSCIFLHCSLMLGSIISSASSSNLKSPTSSLSSISLKKKTVTLILFHIPHTTLSLGEYVDHYTETIDTID